jgi:beta-glucosidase
MKEDQGSSIFPKHFFWGVSTASHQVEGNTVNQWTVWELAHAKEQAITAHQRYGWLPNWSDIRVRAEEAENYVSGQGVAHLKLFREDFGIAKSLNMNAFRFGIEWARLEPEPGKWDEAAFEHYRTYIRELRERHLEPFMNIWHWTSPTWFTDKGGFEHRKNLKYFHRFIRKVADEFAEDLNYIITINEPNVDTSFGYLVGLHPPHQQKQFVKFCKVYWNMVTCHRKAYAILKTKKPTLQVGIAQQLANIQAKRPHNMFDEFSTKWMRYFWNWWFIKRIRNQQDFVGINYYFSDYYTGWLKRENPKVPLNDMGWYMEPEGLYPLLLRTWARFKKPIYITENGVADSEDQYRRWWLEETIIAMERALSEGVDLRGYFHWSLLDNFEWQDGWWPKFGLVKVDREHGMKRTVRPSAKWFAARIKALSQD